MTKKDIFDAAYQATKAKMAEKGTADMFINHGLPIAGWTSLHALARLNDVRAANKAARNTLTGLMVQAPQMAKQELAKRVLIAGGKMNDIAPVLETGAKKNSAKWAAGGAVGGAVGGALTKEGAVDPATLGRAKAIVEPLIGPLALAVGSGAFFAGANRIAQSFYKRRATKQALKQLKNSTLKDTFSGANRVAAETLHELKPSNTKYLDLMKREQMKHRAAAFGAPAVGGAAIGYGVTS